ncbi:Transcription termination factor 2, mitochondrial isoform X1 [Aix galericulata]|nr:Transcription termination factor 2, mitochondrial isoform X1 [Aix galericulata]
MAPCGGAPCVGLPGPPRLLCGKWNRAASTERFSTCCCTSLLHELLKSSLRHARLGLHSTMLRGAARGAKDTFTLLLARSQYCNPGLKFLSLRSEAPNRSFSTHSTHTTDTKAREENKKTIESLYRLSVDVKKIRRLKEWVLLQEVAYAQEVAGILQEMGADEPAEHEFKKNTAYTMFTAFYYGLPKEDVDATEDSKRHLIKQMVRQTSPRTHMDDHAAHIWSTSGTFQSPLSFVQDVRARQGSSS